MKSPDTLAAIETLESMPFEQQPVAQNTFAMLLQGAAKNPDALALRYIVDGEHYQHSMDYTFAQLMAKLYQTANVFHTLGVGPTDVISLLLPNIPEMAFILWGGQAVGIVNPINPLLEAPQIAEIMRAAKTNILVCLGPFPQTDIWQKVERVKDEVPSLKTIITVDLKPYLPLPSRVGAAVWQLAKPKARSAAHQLVRFNQWLDRQPTDHFTRSRPIKPQDVACYFHTGGTTGTPKLAPLSHYNLTSETWMASQLMPSEPGDSPLTFFCGLPWFHVNGVIVTGSVPWSMGYTLVMGSPQGYRGKGIIPNFWMLVAHYRLSAFSGVPTVFSYLLDVPLQGCDISSLRFALCGAAPMPVDLLRSFEKLTGLSIVEGYGFTEGSCISSCNPITGERIKGSIGLRLPYQQIKPVILDEQTGTYLRDADTNEIGTLVARGPNVFAGYLQPEHNRDIWVDTKDGGPLFYNTGDLGRMDERSYLYITGRRKELIIRGGHNIDPKCIEDALAAHPAVALVAAVGSPDAKLGEVPVAYVTLQAGKQTNEAELLAFARAHIQERAAVPKRITIEAELPLTAIGKLFKPALVKREIGRVFTHEIAGIAGVTLQALTIEEDKKLGYIARIKYRSADEATSVKRIEAALSAYSTPFELLWHR